DENIKHLEYLAKNDITLAVVDNSPVRKKIEMGNISYIYNQNKGGIAGALNKGINALIASGCEFFYTF
ncbi:TPA: hypothetical protein ACN1AZ_004972, partial [Escherichia coli]